VPLLDRRWFLPELEPRSQVGCFARLPVELIAQRVSVPQGMRPGAHLTQFPDPPADA
jgi:hypothetical protein